MESDYWLASSVVSKTNPGYLIDVNVAASGKIRDNVEALGAEQVYSIVLCVGGSRTEAPTGSEFLSLLRISEFFRFI